MGYTCKKHNRIGFGEKDSCSDCFQEKLAQQNGLRVTLKLGLGRSRRSQSNNSAMVMEENPPPKSVPQPQPSTKNYYSVEQWDKSIKMLESSDRPFSELQKYFEMAEQQVLNQQKRLELDQSLTNEQRVDIGKRLADANRRLGALRLQREDKLKTDRGDEERLISSMRNDQDNRGEIEQRNRNAQQNIQETIRQKQERERLRTEFKTQALLRRKRKEEGTNKLAVLIRGSEDAPKKNEQKTVQLLDSVANNYSQEKIRELNGELLVTGEGDSAYNMINEIFRTSELAKEILKQPLPIDESRYEQLELKLKLTKKFATEYKNTHGKVQLTSKGRARAKASEEILKTIDELEKQLKERKELQLARSVQVTKMMEGVLDSVASGAVTPGMVRQLEALLSDKNLSEEAKREIDVVIRTAKRKMQALAEQAWRNLDQPSNEERAEILLEFGDCKPPGEKGQSDSFFIKGANGQNAFLFKPSEGEARNSDLWIEGGGAPREILATKVSEVFERDLGINLNMPRSVPFSTEDESFVQGSKSKSKTRTGALQTAIQFKPGDPVDVKSFAAKNRGTSEGRRAQFLAFDPKDTESIALLDFITLNGDRHAANMLVQDPTLEPGKTRLVPIDAGQMLPTKNVFRMGGSSSMTCKKKFDPDKDMTMDEADNLLMQLPDALVPFSESTKEAIEKIDPEKFVESIRLQYQDLGNEVPEMAGKVSEDSFDLMKRSIMFLKKAAKANLTKFQISQVYATGFIGIMDAPEENLESAIDKAIDIVREYDQLGGNDHEIFKIRELSEAMPELSMEERLELLKMQPKPEPEAALEKVYRMFQAELHDIEQFLLFDEEGPFKLGTQLTEEFSTDNFKFLQRALAYKRAGGDPRLRSILDGDPVTFNIEVNVYLSHKMKKLINAMEITKLGGYATMKQVMGDLRFNQEILGKEVYEQEKAYLAFLENQK